MQINNFEVTIHPGTETPEGYVELSHNTQYTLRLSNHWRVRCDAQVEIDGKPVGAWRIPARQAISLERPLHDTGRFTFYKLGTPEATQAQLQANEKLGLIQVTFLPEKPQARPLARLETEEETESEDFGAEDLCESVSAGGTGLSGESSQRFGMAGQIEHDVSQQTVISLRLVCREPRIVKGTAQPVQPEDLTRPSPQAEPPKKDVSEQRKTIIDYFLAEADEHLQLLADGLLLLEKNRDDSSVVDEIFRSADTIRGSAALVGFHVFSKLAQYMKKLLGKIRHREIELSDSVIDLLLQTVDYLNTMVERIPTDKSEDDSILKMFSDLYAEFLAAPQESIKDREEKESRIEVIHAAPSGLTLRITLKDGLLQGNIADTTTTIVFHSATFGDINILLANLREIAINGSLDDVTLQTKDGDTLRGTLKAEELALENTSLGNISVPLRHVLQITVADEINMPIKGTATPKDHGPVLPLKERPRPLQVKDFFETLHTRFIPENAQALDMHVVYEITGEDGGVWTIKIQRGRLTVTAGKNPTAMAHIKTAAKTYMKFATGKMDERVAMQLGKLKITGEKDVLTILSRCFRVADM